MKSAALIAICLLLVGCPNREIIPLVGEDPEIAELLEQPPPESPASSPLAAARRLHQALVQNDTDLVWTLLAKPTRRALDERGASIGTNGRELLDASTLPGPGGTVRKVRFETLLFGPEVADLNLGPSDGAEATVFAVSKSGSVTELRLTREEDGWKLLKSSF